MVGVGSQKTVDKGVRETGCTARIRELIDDRELQPSMRLQEPTDRSADVSHLGLLKHGVGREIDAGRAQPLSDRNSVQLVRYMGSV